MRNSPSVSSSKAELTTKFRGTQNVSNRILHLCRAALRPVRIALILVSL
jgi:hypothetical protein